MASKNILVACYCIALFVHQLPAQPLEDIAFDLPVFVINTDGQAIPNEPKLDAHLGIINNSNGINFYTDSFNEYDGDIGIEIRGNGSATWLKKAFLFETREANGDNNNVSLLDMPIENDWILYAPYIDRTAMRNILTYDLACQMGSYASRTAYCELIINGEYRGLYVLEEKIKQDVNRVDITKFDDDNSLPDEGGYIIRIDSWWNNVVGWQSENLFEKDGVEWWPRYQYVYPNYNKISEAQKQYIQDYMLDVDNLLFDLTPEDSNTNLTDLLDLNSFVDLFIINEFTRNPDGYRLSTYMHLDPTADQPRLKLGPVWDYNVGYGNYINRFGNATTWEYDNDWWEIEVRIPFWWETLMANQAFLEKVICRWEELRESIITPQRFNQKIDSLDLLVQNAIERNNQVWTTDLITSDVHWASTESYDQNVSDLKTWIQDRIDWMDNKFASLKKTYAQEPINVYPNPSIDAFTIDFHSPNMDVAKLYLYDMQGRLAQSDKVVVVKGSNQIKMENIKVGNGSYFLKLEVGSQVHTQKLMILNGEVSY